MPLIVPATFMIGIPFMVLKGLAGSLPERLTGVVLVALRTAAVPARRRPVFDPETAEFVDVAIYERAALVPGATLKGPAVVVEDETSTVIGRNFDACIDAFGYIELVRRG